MAAPYLKNGKLEEHDGALRLTREGIFISDSIMSDLLWAVEKERWEQLSFEFSDRE